MTLDSLRLSLPLAATACCLVLLTGHVAEAQIIAGPGLGKNPQQQEKPALAPPPALPGAQQDSGRAAPSEKTPTDMLPTDALFDAIDRGDIVAARDAINRGAELNGHNLLGMTPMELSIDLGRNNITFLLLSLRGTETAPSPGKPAAATKTAEAGSARRLARHAERRAERSARPVREAAAPAPPNPRLFAGDGGQPIPSAGFLGFGSR